MTARKHTGYYALIACVVAMLFIVLGARVVAQSNSLAGDTINLGTQPQTDELSQSANNGEGEANASVTSADAQDLNSRAQSALAGASSASDIDGQYNTDMSADIFKIEYDSDTGAGITVQSEDGAKVIAPGTSGSYVFNLANTAGTALDFGLAMSADAQSAGQEMELPIQIKLYDYTGKYIVGSADAWGTIAELDAACDSGTIARDHYIAYTLEWLWLFESDDQKDTQLGKSAANATTTASESADVAGSYASATSTAYTPENTSQPVRPEGKVVPDSTDPTQYAASTDASATSTANATTTASESADVAGSYASATSTAYTPGNTSQPVRPEGKVVPDSTGKPEGSAREARVLSGTETGTTAPAGDTLDVGVSTTQPITFTVSFAAYGSANVDGAQGTGLGQTGDRLYAWISIIAAGAIALVFALFALWRMKKEKPEARHGN